MAAVVVVLGAVAVVWGAVVDVLGRAPLVLWWRARARAAVVTVVDECPLKGVAIVSAFLVLWGAVDDVPAGAGAVDYGVGAGIVAVVLGDPLARAAVEVVMDECPLMGVAGVSAFLFVLSFFLIAGLLLRPFQVLALLLFLSWRYLAPVASDPVCWAVWGDILVVGSTVVGILGASTARASLMFACFVRVPDIYLKDKIWQSIIK